MAGYHSLIGYPWIIDCLSKYDSRVVKQKPVPCQVVEFLRVPDRSVNSEGCEYPEAVVNISDQKYYIRAVITKEAQQMLESEDDHFTLADIKNKIIILKKFSVCFTAVEDLRTCEFYVTVQHFSVLPMETNSVDILNCNMEPGVREKIKELWQNFMTERETNETSPDMNLSDVSITQLLMVASEEKFSDLKSIAEQCLELEPSVTQDNPSQGTTFWSADQKRNEENTERFVIPVDLLLIPPNEEAALEQMTEFRYEGQCTGERADSSEGENSSQPYSTALSTFSEEPIDEGPSSQSGNPWNKLQSLCVSVATSSDSHPKCSTSVAQKSREIGVGSDPDSSTPDILTPNADVSTGDSPGGKSEVSPLMFSEHSPNPLQPSTRIPRTGSASTNASPICSPGRSLNASSASLNLIPLTQDSLKDSLKKSLSMGSKVQISPIHMSVIESSPKNKRDLFSLSDESNRGKSCSPRTRKASKRKQTSEELASILSDCEQQADRPDCVTTTVSSDEEVGEVPANDDDDQTAVRKQIAERDAAIPVSDMKKKNRKSEQYINTSILSHKSSRKRKPAQKSILQFVVNPKTLQNKDSSDEQLTAKGPTASKTCVPETPPNRIYRPSSSFQAKEKTIEPIIEIGKNKLVHRDGTSFQYKYKPPSEELCACVNTIQIPADLRKWAVKVLSEGQEKAL
ncbi:adrenocortical dysplasia protein homolog [Rhinoderma darwinii]|uniref:adrenocortical dysplasia protein homolog n=1 Tax=Rhinoderma darwinii TaxID=43563 RepID=UPI003F672346